MRFLAGTDLTSEIKQLATGKDLKIAVAYWGKDAFQLLKVDPARDDIQVLCCLKGGKSDPDVIEKFGRRARQHDSLHAKVYLSSNAAVVASANVSSNGMPEEEDSAIGLVEAGICIDDPQTLANIRNWFDHLFERSSEIDPDHLAAARLARSIRIWSGASPKSRSRSLLGALRDGGKLEFAQQRIFIAIYSYRSTPRERADAAKYFEIKARKIGKDTKIQTPDVAKLDRMLDYYISWDSLPEDAYLLDCQMSIKGNVHFHGVYKTFHDTTGYRVRLDGEMQDLIYVLRPKYNRFPYLLSRDDRLALQRAVPELMATYGNREDETLIVPLLDAAPIILKNA